MRGRGIVAAVLIGALLIGVPLAIAAWRLAYIWWGVR